MGATDHCPNTGFPIITKYLSSVVSIHYFKNKLLNFNFHSSKFFFRKRFCGIRLSQNKAASLFFWDVSFRHSLTLAICWRSSLSRLGSVNFFEVLNLGFFVTGAWQRGSSKPVSWVSLYSADGGAWDSLTVFSRLLSVGWYQLLQLDTTFG